MQHSSISELNDKINKYKNLTDLELHNLATLVAAVTKEKYSIENYRNSLRNIIQRVVIH